MSVSFVRYSPYTSEHSLTGQLVECFRDVFAEEPWDEWLQCAKCGQVWGTKDQELLCSMGYKHCKVGLIDRWPRENVYTDLMREIKVDSSAWLSVDDKKVVGFCWGYPVAKGILEAHLGIKLPSNKVGYGGLDQIAYQDEIGVAVTHRGQKLAKRMMALRHDDFLTKGLQVGVVRTRQFPNPSVTFNWYTEKLGYEIVARYPDLKGEVDGRVVLARPLEGLKELLSKGLE